MRDNKLLEIKQLIISNAKEYYEDASEYRNLVENKYPLTQKTLIDKAIKELIKENKLEVKRTKANKNWYRINSTNLSSI